MWSLCFKRAGDISAKYPISQCKQGSLGGFVLCLVLTSFNSQEETQMMTQKCKIFSLKPISFYSDIVRKSVSYLRLFCSRRVYYW